MKSRQLANVLIKVLGLSVCFYAIPECISGLIMLFSHSGNPSRGTFAFSYPIGTVVQAAVAVLMIAKSEQIAAWMFPKDEA